MRTKLIITKILHLTFCLLWIACDGADTSPKPPAAGWWPQWRGPEGLGVSKELNLPTVWSPGSPNIRWQLDVPNHGNSSPIVSKGRVFLTSHSPDDNKRMVLCVDLKTGERLWETHVPFAANENIHYMTSRAAPTPVTDGEHVYAYFGGVLAKLDREGKIIWNKEIDPEYESTSHYGAAASPILSDNAVIVFHDREKGDADEAGWLAAYDTQTGDLTWRETWKDTCCAYSTPIVRRTATQGDQLINAHSAEVRAYDPATGSRLWSYKHGKMVQIVTSPVIAGDIMVVGGGIHDTFMQAYRLNAGPEPELLWSEKQAVPDLSSPILYNGLLFGITANGVMSCHDPETGQLHWRERLEGSHFYASLVAADGKVYALNGEGVTTVVEAANKFKSVSVNRLFEEDTTFPSSNASPALADGTIVIRIHYRLFAIEREPGT